MADFEVQVREWVEKARRRSGAAFRATAQDAADRVKELTPVDTGFLRANWTAMRAEDVAPVEGRVPSIEVVIAALRLGDKIVILNPVAYARRIEYGFTGDDSRGRSYHQEGRGMVQQTVLEVPRIAQEATARIINGDGNR